MEVLVGRTYRHFKGGKYRVLGIARDVDTLKEKVVYQEVCDETKIWVRDYAEFTSEVDHNKYPDVTCKDRFTLCD